MKHCTMQWKQNISVGGDSYTVFDAIGLEEPQLGVKEYLETVENANMLGPECGNSCSLLSSVRVKDKIVRRSADNALFIRSHLDEKYRLYLSYIEGKGCNVYQLAESQLIIDGFNVAGTFGTPYSQLTLSHRNFWTTRGEEVERMGSDIFNAGSSMGTMPKKIVTQADYFWAKSNAAAAAAAVTPNTTPNIANSGVNGGRWQIRPLLSRVTQAMVDAMRWQIRPLLSRVTQAMIDAVRDTIWAALCAAANLVAKFRRVR
ncbi:hypothetical protein C8R48DRAFT_812344 [Suillus tomentosus]|nr:hypothetical protein C8R48DRAFT_812344 [Suillus tomentosus]